MYFYYFLHLQGEKQSNISQLLQIYVILAFFPPFITFFPSPPFFSHFLPRGEAFTSNYHSSRTLLGTGVIDSSWTLLGTGVNHSWGTGGKASWAGGIEQGGKRSSEAIFPGAPVKSIKRSIQMVDRKVAVFFICKGSGDPILFDMR